MYAIYGNTNGLMPSPTTWGLSHGHPSESLYWYTVIVSPPFFPNPDSYVTGYTKSPHGGYSVNWSIPGLLIHWLTNFQIFSHTLFYKTHPWVLNLNTNLQTLFQKRTTYIHTAFLLVISWVVERTYSFLNSLLLSTEQQDPNIMLPLL